MPRRNQNRPVGHYLVSHHPQQSRPGRGNLCGNIPLTLTQSRSKFEQGEPLRLSSQQWRRDRRHYQFNAHTRIFNGRLKQETCEEFFKLTDLESAIHFPDCTDGVKIFPMPRGRWKRPGGSTFFLTRSPEEQTL